MFLAFQKLAMERYPTKQRCLPLLYMPDHEVFVSQCNIFQKTGSGIVVGSIQIFS